MFTTTTTIIYALLPSVLGVTFDTLDSAGYYLPSSGAASTTQFYLGPELSSGTACGVDALPNGESTSGAQGGGPGYLYVGRHITVVIHVSRDSPQAGCRQLSTSLPSGPIQAVRKFFPPLELVLMTVQLEPAVQEVRVASATS